MGVEKAVRPGLAAAPLVCLGTLATRRMRYKTVTTSLLDFLVPFFHGFSDAV